MILFSKQSVYPLYKCYAVSPLNVAGSPCIIAASEAPDECLLIRPEEKIVKKIWKEPGGTMSLIPVEEEEGVFLASQRFFGPDHSQRSQIVIGQKDHVRGWKIETIYTLPHLHRFGILRDGKSSYFIGCTIKSSSEYEGDWRTPGKVYVGELNGDWKNLRLQELPISLFKNHGYYRMVGSQYEYALISAEEGVFEFMPPFEHSGKWKVRKIFGQPVSDAVLIDLDGDGNEELITIEPFHGNFIRIYRWNGKEYQKIFEYQAEFAHSLWAGLLYGTPSVIIGHRRGKKQLMHFYFKDKIQMQVIDTGVASVNVCCYEVKGEMWLVSANQGMNEVAFYKIEQSDV